MSEEDSTKPNCEDCITTKEGPKIGYYSGPGFVNQRVEYFEEKGMAMIEGDICLGTVEEMKQSTQDTVIADKQREAKAILEKERGSGRLESAILVGSQYRWLNCTMPYGIDPSLPDQQRVTKAIAHITEKTGFKFVERTNESDWVFFTDNNTGCNSAIGRRGGQQNINLAPGCNFGSTVHEILHALGFWHEQSRNDRDNFVEIRWQNIRPGYENNFSQYLNSGQDVGDYDYCSIMHYPTWAFQKNANPTIVAIQPTGGCVLGQRGGLSDGDINGMRHIYPECAISPCDKYKTRATTYYKKYRDTKNLKFLCLYYHYFSRHYSCAFKSSQKKSDKCKYYMHRSNYFNCMYKLTNRRRYLDIYKQFRKRYYDCNASL